MTHKIKLKIFYHPETLKIMGLSDGDSSMEFPYVETTKIYYSTEGLEIVEKKGEMVVQPRKGYKLKDVIEQSYIRMRKYK